MYKNRPKLRKKQAFIFSLSFRSPLFAQSQHNLAWMHVQASATCIRSVFILPTVEVPLLVEPVHPGLAQGQAGGDMADKGHRDPVQTQKLNKPPNMFSVPRDIQHNVVQ